MSPDGARGALARERRRVGVEAGRQPTPSTPARVGADRPRLVVLEDITLTTPADPYLSLSSLATYTGCSARWLRAQLRDPHHPLPHYRPGGKILVRRSEWDAWLARYRRVGDPAVRRVVDDVLASLAGPPSRLDSV